MKNNPVLKINLIISIVVFVITTIDYLDQMTSYSIYSSCIGNVLPPIFFRIAQFGGIIQTFLLILNMSIIKAEERSNHMSKILHKSIISVYFWLPILFIIIWIVMFISMFE